MHISFGEILVILLVTLLVIKPEQLPRVARALGRAVRWLRQTTGKITAELEQPLEKNQLGKKHE